ncbi:hypothetical protein BpHYR1_027964 [Brachionus plicatilis]|uniref:Uncharacterized protein n=1 Tax=Brachionus plicatilis TaxID=10195 RepID=A0A3M7QUR1_BRAPC|nr:hypothetical protein BpHYR1_027964 [Brachionus plicatilis]
MSCEGFEKMISISESESLPLLRTISSMLVFLNKKHDSYHVVSIEDYVGAIFNSSRICSNKTPLSGIWNEINEWMIKNAYILLSLPRFGRPKN